MNIDKEKNHSSCLNKSWKWIILLALILSLLSSGFLAFREWENWWGKDNEKEQGLGLNLRKPRGVSIEEVNDKESDYEDDDENIGFTTSSSPRENFVKSGYTHPSYGVGAKASEGEFSFGVSAQAPNGNKWDELRK